MGGGQQEGNHALVCVISVDGVMLDHLSVNSWWPWPKREGGRGRGRSIKLLDINTHTHAEAYHTPIWFSILSSQSLPGPLRTSHLHEAPYGGVV